jgi:hypothetical protein
MMRWLAQLRALFFVALVAGFGLNLFVQGFVFIGMHLVAGVTSDTSVFMAGTRPQCTFLVFVMTILARPVSGVSRIGADLAEILAEVDVRFRLRSELGRVVGMGSTCAMATYAVRRAFVGNKAMRRTTVICQIFGVVTGHTKRSSSWLFRPSQANLAQQTKTNNRHNTLKSHPNSYLANHKLVFKPTVW